MFDCQLQRCEKFAHAVLPDMRRKGIPLYCVNCPEEFHLAEALAFTGETGVRELVKQTLIDTGKYRGPGISIVFSRDFAPDDDNHAFAITAHELAHNWQLRKPTEGAEATAALFKKLVVSQLSRALRAPTCYPAWYPTHDLNFHRFALHIHHRAWKAGYEVGLPEMNIFGECYGLGPAYRYMHALRPEVERMATWPFEAIAQTKPPREFIAMWEEDFMFWINERKNACSTQLT